MDTEPMVRDETVTLNGLHFHYRDWGDPDAPPLVLLHAYTSHARSWDTAARALADRFRVLALDLRGHGESAWAADYHEQRLLEDLTAFVEALGLGTFSAVGFSIGSSVAGSYAALYPDRVKRLVVVECFALETEPRTASHIHALRSLPTEYQGAAAAVAAQAAAAYRPLAPYAPDDELSRWMLGGLKQGPDGGWTWRYDPVLRVPGPPGRLNPTADEFAQRLADVACPMLVVVGAESFHAEGAEQIAAANPHARLVKLPRAGHWAPLDNPRGFLEVVGRFLTDE
jgi:pimeloyl-ACP methyl ester carboxylesterase